MIYGHKNGLQHRHKSLRAGIGRLVDRHFHQKYLRSFLWIMISGQALFLVPLFFYVSQNYAFFTAISLTNRPQILQDLDREMGVLALIALLSVASSLFFGFIVVQNHTRKMLDPLEQIKLKLAELTEGKITEFKLDSETEPEFAELVSQFSAYTRKLVSDKEMIAQQRIQRKVKSIARDAGSSEADSKHRAS